MVGAGARVTRRRPLATPVTIQMPCAAIPAINRPVSETDLRDVAEGLAACLGRARAHESRLSKVLSLESDEAGQR